MKDPAQKKEVDEKGVLDHDEDLHRLAAQATQRCAGDKTLSTNLVVYSSIAPLVSSVCY